MTKQNVDKLDFVAATTHEFKTSLTAIIVSAELLDEELKPHEKSVMGRLIQSIIRNAHSIDERLSLFMETGGLEGEESPFHPEPVEIGQIVQNVTSQLYPEIQSKKQSLMLDTPDTLPQVQADRWYLEQILLTLIANASKFTGEKGQIKVRAFSDGESMICQVSDTGVGIPAEEQERVFQAYYQVNRAKDLAGQPVIRKGYSSGGLGLAIAKFLVEIHGGKIWLESTVGQGSSFFFSLPLVVPDESSNN